MSSIFFQFYYDDGKNRPFDADAISVSNQSLFEVPPVVTDVLFDIFEVSPQELQESGLVEASFLPSFILQYTEIAKADGEPLDGVGVEPNIYFDSATILIEPSQLKSWAHAWFQTLRHTNDVQRQEVLQFNWKHGDEIVKDLSNLTCLAEYALNKQLNVMLFITW